MKLHEGWFWPDNSPDGWTSRLPVVNGRVSYAGKVIIRAIAACKRKRVAIDGGAHIGLLSAPMLRQFKRVHAFEPAPDNFECLELNCPSAKLTRHRAALAERSGVGVLHGMDGKPMGHSLESFRGGATLEVTTIALDDLRLSNVDLIKLDLEGGEYAALLGAQETITRCRPVVLIEEKFDPERRASALLERLGMVRTYETKRDRLFIWTT
jgi:FkbM family methyltransferase